MQPVKPRPVAFRRLLVAHGDAVDENAREEYQRAFRRCLQAR
jgi:hypothetical protein